MTETVDNRKQSSPKAKRTNGANCADRARAIPTLGVCRIQMAMKAEKANEVQPIMGFD